MKTLLTSASFLLLAAIGSQAASIGINFGSGRPNASLAAGDSAGVIIQTNWNNAAGNSGNIASLTNDSGSASGAGVTWEADEQWSVGGTIAGANGTLLNGFISENNNATTTSISVSSVPYAAYDLYVYLSHDRNFEDVILTETGGAFGPFTAVENNTDLTAAVTFEEQTTSATTAGNYVRFSGLTTANLTMTLGAIDANYTDGVTTGGSLDRNAIAGLQIVQVPEPSAALLAVLGAAGLAARRRRK